MVDSIDPIEISQNITRILSVKSELFHYLPFNKRAQVRREVLGTHNCSSQCEDKRDVVANTTVQSFVKCRNRVKTLNWNRRLWKRLLTHYGIFMEEKLNIRSLFKWGEILCVQNKWFEFYTQRTLGLKNTLCSIWYVFILFKEMANQVKHFNC